MDASSAAPADGAAAASSAAPRFQRRSTPVPPEPLSSRLCSTGKVTFAERTPSNGGGEDVGTHVVPPTSPTRSAENGAGEVSLTVSEGEADATPSTPRTFSSTLTAVKAATTLASVGRRSSVSELTLSAVNVLKSTGGSRPRPDGIDELDAKFFSASVQRHIYRQQNARRCRTRVQLLLDEPRSSRAALVVHIVLVVFILLSIVVVVLDSIDPGGNQTLVLLELICSVAFTIEVIFRLAVVDGLWPLITDVCLYIDIIAILPFVFDLVCVATGDFGPLPEFEGEPEPEVVPDNGLAVHTNPFDWLRVARLLRLFKLARHFEGSRVIVDTLKRSFYALLVPLLFLLTGVIIFAGLLTYVEQDGEARDDFGNILKSSWFVLVTFSTVGYGDVTPRTAWGQLVTSVAILCGVLFMAMPITIVGNNFATVWEEKEAVAVVLKMQVSNGPPLLPPQLHRHHNSTAASTATSLHCRSCCSRASLARATSFASSASSTRVGTAPWTSRNSRRRSA